MNNKAIDILKENNLFDEEENSDIKTNNFEDFLKTYSFNKGISKLPQTITRDSKGYILFNEIPFIESNKEIFKENPFMHNNCAWFLLNNGSKILLKEDENDILTQELLIMYFLKSLNLNCADYDGAIIDDKKYIISPSFLNHNEEIFDPITNPFDLILSYEEYKKYNLEDFYLKTIFSDYIYGNADRDKNFGIIKKDNRYKNGILFDNAEVSLWRNSLNYPSINDNNSIDFIINYLLNYEVIVDWLKTTVKNANLYSCIEKIIKEKGFYIPDEIYKKNEFFFKDSEDIINDELKLKGINLKIKLT